LIQNRTIDCSAPSPTQLISRTESTPANNTCACKLPIAAGLIGTTCRLNVTTRIKEISVMRLIHRRPNESMACIALHDPFTPPSARPAPRESMPGSQQQPGKHPNQHADKAGRPSRDHEGDHPDRDGPAHPQRHTAGLPRRPPRYPPPRGPAMPCPAARSLSHGGLRTPRPAPR
jgi:hypothetical protein